MSWATPVQTAASVVVYGLSDDNLHLRAQGTSTSYLAPYWHHHVVLPQLQV